MPPRPDELPEGTDHIINGAMETNGDGGGAAGGGFVGAGTSGDDTGGTAASGGGQAMATTGDTGTGGGDEGAGVRDQLKNQVNALRGQAGDRAREFAEGGKTRASDALEELSRVVADTADSIDERLGGQYGEYARRASDAVSGFADTLRRTDVDELYGNVQSAVRKSPGIAIGIAAVVGFTLARLVKAGLSEGDGPGSRGSTGSDGTAGA
ncbi:MAG: hypothetical protein JOZ90_02260 [Alphaproteobacteria bacterium]|nr:hypothetical protein [Alphaproteobacteria bacterium]MBV9372551.1 hypothetical protein [Alphaproteobacteria bacterium]MBV9899901.1 hypothetical protein [Alphaproteobacteria bacterium]